MIVGAKHIEKKWLDVRAGVFSPVYIHRAADALGQFALKLWRQPFTSYNTQRDAMPLEHWQQLRELAVMRESVTCISFP